MYKKIYYQKLSSTSDFLKEAAQVHVDDKTVVIAAEQTDGRGQGDNQWFSKPGGLYFSILLKPLRLEPVLTIMTGLAVIEALEQETGLNFKLKWPNDLFYQENKFGGILVEGRFVGGQPEYVIIGCGLNLNQESFPKLEKNRPLSLKQISGHTYDPDLILDAILAKFEQYYQDYEAQNYISLVDRFIPYSYLQGKQVKLKSGAEIIYGSVTGISNYGALLLKTKDSEQLEIISATVLEINT